MKRIVVVGSSGSGKTHVARQLSARLDLPYLELDSIFHREGWHSTPEEQFRSNVAAFAEGPRWVVDGNYSSYGTRDALWPKADTVIWLDLPKGTIVRRVVMRTLRRVITREDLWNGLKEPWSNGYSTDPQKNIIVWAWTQFDHTREKLEIATVDGTWAHTTVYRLRTGEEGDRLLSSVHDSSPFPRVASLA